MLVCLGNLRFLSHSLHRKNFAALMYSGGARAAFRISINTSLFLCPYWLCNRRIATLAGRGNCNHFFFLSASLVGIPGRGISSSISCSVACIPESTPMSSSFSIASNVSSDDSSLSSIAASAGNADATNAVA